LEAQMAVQILRRLDVQRVTGLSKATLWRLVKTGDFPQPIKLSERAVGWKASEIDAWIESRPRATSEPQPAT